MENELLLQILEELKELKAGQKATNERLDKVEQEARHTRVLIEN